MHISERAARVRSSGIRRMFDLGSRLKDPLDFSIGQPDFQPPREVQEAAIQAVRAGRNRYTVTQGLPALNERLLELVERRTGVRPEASLVTAGVAGGLTLAMVALTDPQDQVLVPDPYFVCYTNLAAMLTREPAFYDLYPDFRITPERLEEGVTGDVRVLIVNSPSNPTGRVLEDEELAAVAAFARRHDLAVISDEIYDAFSYEGPAPSMLAHHDQTILLGGFSKTFGMPGWRLGYAVGPAEVIDKMRTLQQFSYVCAPAPLQHGALAALDVDMEPWIRAYARKRDLVYEGLSGTFELVKPTGAFYAFPRVPGGESASAFMERALGRNLLVVPGSAFSRRDTHLRLSYAMPDERLQEGVKVLRELAGA